MIVNDITAALPALQAQAESLMVDTFTAYAPAGPGARTIGADGMESGGYTSPGSTKGKVQGRTRIGDPHDRTVLVGGVDRPVLEAGLHIPLSAPVPDAGDMGEGWEYECTAVGDGSDPALLGRRWLVVGVPAKSFATARRLDVVEL